MGCVWHRFGIVVGIAMGLLLPLAGHFLLPNHPYLSGTLSFCIIVAISYGFELTSKLTGRGHYDIMDAVASTLGGLLGMAVIVLVKAPLYFNK